VKKREKYQKIIIIIIIIITITMLAHKNKMKQHNSNPFQLFQRKGSSLRRPL